MTYYRKTLSGAAVVLLAWLAPFAGARPGSAVPPLAASAPFFGAVPPPTPTAGSVPPFRWPLDGPPRPVRRFDPPPRPWLPGHRGVDLADVAGATVRAAGPGDVLFAGWIAGRPVISVNHGGGLRTTYEPVSPAVRAGDRLAAGEPLGVLVPGHTGCPASAVPGAGAEPACLHWGLRRGVEYLDPLALVGHGRVRLLPARVENGASVRVGRRSGSAEQPG